LWLRSGGGVNASYAFSLTAAGDYYFAGTLTLNAVRPRFGY